MGQIFVHEPKVVYTLKENANLGIKGAILGLIFYYFIISGGKNVAKTTFEGRKILKDGGTGRKLLLNCVSSLLFSESSIKNSILFQWTFVLHSVTCKVSIKN